MPRAGRIKNPEAIYHVMSRSISEFNLFPENSDKDKFLDILQECMNKYNCKTYAYCLMTNHYHLMLDTCGFDISKFMKSLNQRYVKYVNKTYKRRGHLLDERFSSKIIDSEEYLLTVSAYIHNNPKDLPEYNGKESEYQYSSMGIYLGKRKDKRGIVDTDFILGCVNEADRKEAVKRYEEMVIEHRDIGINRKLKQYLEEFQNEQYEYRSYSKVLLRDKKPEDVINLIANRFGVKDTSELMHRWKRKTMDFRRVTAYVLNAFCGMGINEVAGYMHNITASCCTNLSNRGFEIIRNNKWNSLVTELYNA